MTTLLQDLIFKTAARTPDAEALKHRDTALSYAELRDRVETVATQLVGLGVDRAERVAVYLEKRIEAVVAMFGAAAAGAVFVPVSPVLRPNQVAHILKDCNVRVLITSHARLESLSEVLPGCHDLNTIILVDGDAKAEVGAAPRLPRELGQHARRAQAQRRTAAPCHRHRHGGDLLHVGFDRHAEGRRAVAPQPRHGRAQRQRISREHQQRPHPVVAGAQLRCRVQPADHGLLCRCGRRAHRFPVPARRHLHRRQRRHHRDRRRAAAVEFSSPICRGRRRRSAPCATSPIPAIACRRRRSTYCARRCPTPSPI